MNPTGTSTRLRGAPAWPAPSTPRVAGRCPICLAFVPDEPHEVWCPDADPTPNPADGDDGDDADDGGPWEYPT